MRVRRLLLLIAEPVLGFLSSGQLHWRHYNLGMTMIGLLARSDYPLPGQVTSILVQNLVHDTIHVRKMAIHMLGCVLKQQKKPHPKVTIDIPNKEIPGMF